MFYNHSDIFTQLVYRLSQIHELKYKRIFLANFFKTYYFHEMNTQIYVLSESDFNHICYIYKEPIQMIRLLVKKIVLYDDKIEVFYNIPRLSPLFTLPA